MTISVRAEKPPSLWRQVGALVAVTIRGWSTPAPVRRGIVAGMIVGAVGSAVPDGFLGRAEATGALGGACWGLAAAAVLAPFLGGAVALGFVGAEQDAGPAAALYLAQVSRGARSLAQLQVGLLTLALVGVSAGLGGAVGGMAASLVQHSSLTGVSEPRLVVGASLTLLWWFAVAAGFATTVRRIALVSAFVLSAPTALLLVPTFRDFAAGRLLLDVCPVTPWWAIVHGTAADEYAYRPASWTIAVALGAWPLVAGAILFNCLRRRPF